MTKRKKDWVYIVTPEGKQMIASPEYIKDLIGLSRLDVYNVYNRIEQLERAAKKLREPFQKQKILNLLSNGERHNKMWLENRVPCDWCTCRKLTNELVTEGKLKIEKAGSQDMFKLA